MESLIVGLVASLVEQLPGVIAAVQASTQLTEEQKKKFLERLVTGLEGTVAAVQNVHFKGDAP